MVDRIESLYINSFRGIKELKLEKCNDINIILGDNNSGKTSILEAINLLKSDSLFNMFELLKCRNLQYNIQNYSFLFPVGGNKIEIFSKLRNSDVNVQITYERSKIIFDKNTFLSDITENLKPIFSQIIDLEKKEGKEEEQISGTINYNNQTKNYSFIGYDVRIGRINKEKRDLLRIITETPFDHFKETISIMPSILSNSDYYSIVIEVLKLFDPSIEGILLINDKENVNDTSIFIKSEGKDPLPLSIYGDGLKKVVLIAGLVAKAKDGILLIDEVETSLHHQYYEDVFSFLVRVARVYNIQLFMTTHNIETIKCFLEISQKYKEDKEFFNVYTIRNRSDKTYSRLLVGKEAYNFIIKEKNEVRL